MVQATRHGRGAADPTNSLGFVAIAGNSPATPEKARARLHAEPAGADCPDVEALHVRRPPRNARSEHPEPRHAEPDPADIIEIHPLLHRALAATRWSWQAHADVRLHFDARVICVKADAREVTLACTRAVVETARVVAERDGTEPVRRGRVTIATSRHAQRVDVSVATDGFRHVLQLVAID